MNRWPVYPAAAAAAVILNLHAGAAAVPEALYRPLLLVVAAVAAVQLLLTLVGRDRHQGAFAAALLVLAVFDWRASLSAVVVGGSLVALRIVLGRREPPVPWARLSSSLNVFAVTLLALSIAGDLSALVPTGRGSGPTGEAPAGAPDIYLILLDGYPRADTLAKDFGIDNEPFLADLEDLGFDVARESTANYNMTLLTLASLLSHQHVGDLPGIDPDRPARDQYRDVARALNHGRVLDELHAFGYETVSITSTFGRAALLAADTVLDSGQLDAFEYTLFQHTARSGLIPSLRTWLVAQHRDRLMTSFDRLAELPSTGGDRPRFILAHLMAPHPPLVLGPDGEARDIWACYPEECEFWDSGWSSGLDVVVPAMRDQLAYVNRRLLEAVRKIQATSDRPPVIVVFSDHGYRHVPEDREETLRNLFAVYAPGQPDLFPEDATPINTFPRLLNAYFDAGLSLEEESSWWVDMSALDSRGILALEPAQP